jgi:hypothetical protein
MHVSSNILNAGHNHLMVNSHGVGNARDGCSTEALYILAVDLKLAAQSAMQSFSHVLVCVKYCSSAGSGHTVDVHLAADRQCLDSGVYHLDTRTHCSGSRFPADAATAEKYRT